METLTEKILEHALHLLLLIIGYFVNKKVKSARAIENKIKEIGKNESN
jgi:hypothetical protein